MSYDVKTVSEIIGATIETCCTSKTSETVATLHVDFFFLFRSEVQIELTKIEQGRIEINLLRLNASSAVLGHVFTRAFSRISP
jgi:hypothetical protein